MISGLRRAACCLLLFSFVGLMGCGDDSAKMAQHLTRAQAFLEEEEFGKAIIEFRNVLQLAPKDAEAHYGLAKAYFGANKLPDGYWWLSETVRLDPRNWQARYEYGEVSRLAGKYEDALSQADAIIDGDPDRVEAYTLKAQVLEALSRGEEAQAFYEMAIEKDPDDSMRIMGLGTYLVRQGRREEAEPYFHQAIAAEKSFLTYFALAGFLRDDLERLDEAEKAYLSARDVATEDKVIYAHRVLASFYYTTARVDRAEEVLREGLKQHPENLDLVYLLARFYLGQGDQEKADQMMEAATKARPNEVRPFLALSIYRHRLGDFEGALAAANAGLKVDAADKAARLRVAELLIEKGVKEGSQEPIAEGRSIIDAVLAQEPSSPEGIYLRSKLQLADRDLDAALAGFRRVIEARPDWAQPHLLLGTALFQAKDLHGARAEIARALELDGTLVEARKLLARIHSRLGEVSFAIEEGMSALKAAPEDNALRVMVAQDLMRSGKRLVALDLLLEVPDDGQDEKSLYAIGKIYYLEGDYEKARDYLTRAEGMAKHNTRIIEALFELDHKEGRLDESYQRIQEALVEHPNNGSLTYLRGMVALLSGDQLVAETDFRKAIYLSPNDMRAYQGLAAILGRSDRRQEVIDTYETALRSKPEGAAGIYLMVGTLYELSGLKMKAIERYGQALDLDPNLAPAKNNLAYLLADTGGDLDRALELAQGAKEQIPEDPSVSDTLGWVLYKKGIPSAAITYLQEAVAGLPVGSQALGMVQYHLALAYELNGDVESAKEVLTEALANYSETSEQEMLDGTTIVDPNWVKDAQEALTRLNESA